MQPFDFCLEEDWQNLDYRFRGSYIFDSDYNPLFVDSIEEGTMYVTFDDGDGASFTDENTDGLLYGVPEHGWHMRGGRPHLLRASFPERKWKYGYQPELDTGDMVDLGMIKALASPIKDGHKEAFLRGDGVFSRAIASLRGVVYCHQKSVGVVDSGAVIITPKYDFISFELPQDWEVVIRDNL